MLEPPKCHIMPIYDLSQYNSIILYETVTKLLNLSGTSRVGGGVLEGTCLFELVFDALGAVVGQVPEGGLKVVVMLERELHFDKQVAFCLRGNYFLTNMLRFAQGSTTFVVEGSVLLRRGLLFE